MSTAHSRTVNLGSHQMHCMEAGQGPLVLMCHGFPESWYSWRHQLAPLAEAGYHAVAMDMRGYGGSYKPNEIDAYNQVDIAADIAGVIEATGHEQAVIVGHDWGAPAVWNTALLHPSKVTAVAGLSVPYTGRAETSPLLTLKTLFKDRFFYILYFQTPGTAEAELESDVRDFITRFYVMASKQGDGSFMLTKAADEPLLQGFEPAGNLPDWFSEQDLDYYTAEFEQNGFRGPLSWYRNLDRSWERTKQLSGKKITQPALFIAGEQDGVIADRTSLDRMKDNFEDLRGIELIDQCGHWTQQEQPEKVNALLLNFLNSLSQK